jgi:hypothetical protein
MTPEKKAADEKTCQELKNKYQNISLEHYTIERDSNNEVFRVMRDSTNHLYIKKEVRGVGFLGIEVALQDCGSPFAYQYNEWGEQFRIFELIGERWKETANRKYAKVYVNNNKMYIGALFSLEDIDKMSSGEIEKQVIYLNSTNKGILLSNRYIYNHLLNQGLKAGTKEYETEITRISSELKKQYQKLDEKVNK